MKPKRLKQVFLAGMAVICSTIFINPATYAATGHNPQNAPGQNVPGQNTQDAVPQTSNKAKFDPYAKAQTAKLRVRVIDGRTLKPLSGAEVVIVENERRSKTGANGYTPWLNVPVLRNERFRPMVAELHGQLTAIAYKNGYRDSIHMGIRIQEDLQEETTIWMYQITPEDRRIEPVFYEEPYHHLWLVQLADKFRRDSQLGEGWQKP